ncbi:MAG: ABC transporter permease [Saprospiraceae bacterium]|nr:ABC transporter permease [Saprospiraceae bacterium]
MIYHFFKLAGRSLMKSPLFAGLNILGLALGLTVSLLLFLHVRQEWSFDRYHRQAQHIFRVALDTRAYDEDEQQLTAAPNAVAPALREHIPAVTRAARIMPHNFNGTAYVVAGDKKLAENKLVWADPELCDIFDLPVLAGDLKSALSQPNQVALSRSAALRYFGATAPLGQLLRVDQMAPLEVAAVYEDFPAHSTLDAELIGSFSTLKRASQRLSWDSASFETWVLLDPGASRAAVEQQMATLLDQNVAPEDRYYSLWLQPLRDVHLHSTELDDDHVRAGDYRQVVLLGALALAVLLIACFNYMNLSTARSQLRNREVGIHKTMGASRGRLSLRFFAETGVLVGVSLLLAFGMLYLTLPAFNQLAGSRLDFGMLLNAETLLSVAGIGALVVLSAGAYPAFFLTAFQPKNLLQTSFRKNTGAGWLRRGLVTGQFAASVALMICTVVLYRQMQFIQQKKLGFEPEQVVAITATAANDEGQMAALAEGFRRLSAVDATTLAQTYPGGAPSERTLVRQEDDPGGLPLSTNRCGPGFEKVLGLQLLAGAGLPEKLPGDTMTHVVLNETAVKYLGFTPEQAIGRKVICQLGPNAIITGVVNDFHSESLHKPIGAYAFHDSERESLELALVRISAADLPQTLRQIESTFQAVMPQSPFELRFLDDQIDALYRKEQRTARVMLVFACLSIFISCLGLFGLAAFAAEQRTREIGIRRVLGASVASISRLLAADFIRLILLAIVIAAPLAAWAMQRWLQDFAYRIELQGWMFVLGGVLALLVGLLTVGAQSVKAALTDPVRTLRND